MKIQSKASTKRIFQYPLRFLYHLPSARNSQTHLPFIYILLIVYWGDHADSKKLNERQLTDRREREKEKTENKKNKI